MLQIRSIFFIDEYMKILMVCLGNICRSPIAEGILRHKLAEKGIDHVKTDSAGTASYHIGEAPDRRMRATGSANGIDISDLRARQFVREDFESFDIIYAMDKSNYRNILSLARSDSDQQKVKLILNEIEAGDQEVPDPYYGGEEGFQHVFDLLDEAVERVIQRYCE